MIIKNGLVFQNDGFIKKDIAIDGERIVSRVGDFSMEEVYDAEGFFLIPGLVDIHFHGAVGEDFCDTDASGFEKIAQYEATHGIMAVCPATMTYDEEKLGKIMDMAAEYPVGEFADLVGINMEGPFISKAKAGAQNSEYIQKPDFEMVRRLNKRSGGLIKLLDIAPEEEGAMDAIEALKEEMIISLAHSSSDYETSIKAFEAGVSHVTHLYNAMEGINHRKPGPVIAAMEKGAEVELIADGVHVHPAMVRFTFEVFDKVILISDSVEATGMGNGNFGLGGQEIFVEGNLAKISGTDIIAGSVTNLYDCMRNAIKMGVSEVKAIRAASINPAITLAIDKDYGSIEEGKLANIIIADRNYNIVDVICKGKMLQV